MKCELKCSERGGKIECSGIVLHVCEAHYTEVIEFGRNLEREQLFGSSKVKPFIRAKGLLNKYVLELIKEKVLNQALDDIKLWVKENGLVIERNNKRRIYISKKNLTKKISEMRK